MSDATVPSSSPSPDERHTMTLGSGRLTPPQSAALRVLSSGGTQLEAGDAASVDPRTIRRWSTHGPLAEQLDDLAAEATAEARRVILEGSDTAAQIMLQLATREDTPPHTRLRACEAILGHATRFIRRTRQISVDEAAQRLRDYLAEQEAEL